MQRLVKLNPMFSGLGDKWTGYRTPGRDSEGYAIDSCSSRPSNIEEGLSEPFADYLLSAPSSGGHPVGLQKTLSVAGPDRQGINRNGPPGAGVCELVLCSVGESDTGYS